ncbi:uncharacterized protein J3R85_005969 [Psidium guajava]|nr:uncharacterized protein J3R85_005969 [Psidium guajava]
MNHFGANATTCVFPLVSSLFPAVAEIEHGLSDITQSKITVSFTPHLMPMSPGMLSTIMLKCLQM